MARILRRVLGGKQTDRIIQNLFLFRSIDHGTNHNEKFVDITLSGRFEI